MKRLFLLILILFCLQACKEISFLESQPKGKKILHAVPKKLQGKYLLADENGVDADTLFITSTGYRIGNDKKHEAYLSDTLVLKYFKSYYFLNIKEQSDWYLRVIQKDNNGNLLYMTMDSEDRRFNDYLLRLSSEIEIDSVKSNDEMRYRIDPSPKEMIALIKKGFFKKITLKKII